MCVCVRVCVHDAPEIDAAVAAATAAAAAANVYLHEIVREYCVIARQHRRPGVPADQIRSDGGDARVRQSVRPFTECPQLEHGRMGRFVSQADTL